MHRFAPACVVVLVLCSLTLIPLVPASAQYPIDYLVFVAPLFGSPPPVPPPILNGGFEDGYVGWTFQGQPIVTSPARAAEGRRYLSLGGVDVLESARQRVTVPADARYLQYQEQRLSEERACDRDVASVEINGQDVLNPLLCQSRQVTSWRTVQLDVRQFAGQSIDIRFAIRTTFFFDSIWRIDDVRFVS